MTGRTAEAAIAPKTRRMHLNESPYPPSPDVMRAIADAAQYANQYPKQDDRALLAGLSDYCGAPAERIVITNGSNELLHLLPLIADAPIFPKAEMVVVEPSFPTYRKVADFFGMVVRPAAVAASGVADIDAVVREITPHCRLVCVPSPNNPTGGMLSSEQIAQLAARVPDNVLLHFDEAYYEFGRQSGGVETLPLLATRTGPWIASRSFSKAFGLAGLRLGYSICGGDELAQRIRALRPNFSVNMLAQAAGIAALADQAHMHAVIEASAGERHRLIEGLKELGFSPLSSAANFVAFPVPRNIDAVIVRLREAGILVSAFELPDGVAALRVTVGAAADTDALLTSLAPLNS